MMDERRIEAALRGDPPDEPTYRGDVSDRLRARMTAAGQEQPPTYVVELFELAPPTTAGAGHLDQGCRDGHVGGRACGRCSARAASARDNANDGHAIAKFFDRSWQPAC